MIKVAVITVSDRCSAGESEDVSGEVIIEMLEGDDNFEVIEKIIVADEIQDLTEKLLYYCKITKADIILTTGGTGLGPRDVTPEATKKVCDRNVPGLAELMRAESLKKTPNAALSRGYCGICDNTLIINLPGSPKAVAECLGFIQNILPHAVKMMHGGGHEEHS
jgi:molybdenum cofactor synthesis domain-containing protein